MLLAIKKTLIYSHYLWFNANFLTSAASVSALSALDFKLQRDRLRLPNLLCTAINKACYEDRFSMFLMVISFSESILIYYYSYILKGKHHYQYITQLTLIHFKRKPRYKVYFKFIAEVFDLY